MVCNSWDAERMEYSRFVGDINDVEMKNRDD
jgi:hypothetical protein